MNSCGGTESFVSGKWCPVLPELFVSAAAARPVPGISRARLSALLPDWLQLELSDMPCLLSAAPAAVRAACSCSQGNPVAGPPSGWAAYYQQRGIRANSPIALLMDAAMTVHWAAQLDANLDPNNPLTVHLLGAGARRCARGGPGRAPVACSPGRRMPFD